MCQATPILISPVCLCPCEENREGEPGAIASLLPQYAAVMRELAREEGILFVDLEAMTRAYTEKLGEEKAGELYIRDRVHLSGRGADRYADYAARELKKIILKEI